MKSDLEETIEAYEAERIALENQIAAYVAEADYFFAHQHQRALKRINRRLYVLKNLQNPNHSRIAEEDHKMENLNKMKQVPIHKALSKSFLERYIDECGSKIRELKTRSIAPMYDSQEIDEVLFSLVNGSINSFKLYFKNYPVVYAAFSMQGQAIKITLGQETAEFDENGAFHQGKQLKALGFQLFDDEWTFHYTGQFKDALAIKTLLSRLIYDVLQHDRRYDSAKIVLIN